MLSDLASRRGQIVPSEWALSQQAFQWAVSQSPWDLLQVDLFGNAMNHRLPRYFSPARIIKRWRSTRWEAIGQTRFCKNEVPSLRPACYFSFYSVARRKRTGGFSWFFSLPKRGGCPFWTAYARGPACTFRCDRGLCVTFIGAIIIRILGRCTFSCGFQASAAWRTRVSQAGLWTGLRSLVVSSADEGSLQVAMGFVCGLGDRQRFGSTSGLLSAFDRFIGMSFQGYVDISQRLLVSLNTTIFYGRNLPYFPVRRFCRGRGCYFI